MILTGPTFVYNFNLTCQLQVRNQQSNLLLHLLQVMIIILDATFYIPVASTKLTISIQPSKKTASTGVTSPKLAIGSEAVIKCESDESNPVTTITMFQFINSKWETITAGVSSTVTNGQNNGKVATVVLKVKVTKELEHRKYKCTAKYQSTVSGQKAVSFDSPEGSMDANRE
jgi:hypothetical protein